MHLHHSDRSITAAIFSYGTYFVDMLCINYNNDFLFEDSRHYISGKRMRDKEIHKRLMRTTLWNVMLCSLAEVH
jgi:hypothetical protein